MWKRSKPAECRDVRNSGKALAAKIAAAGLIAASGTTVVIVKAGTVDAQRALAGERPSTCTVIERAPRAEELA